MQLGLTYSILLHILLFLVLMFGVDYSRRLQPQNETILLELMPISVITNVKTTVNDVKPLDTKKEIVSKNDAKQDNKTVLKDSEFENQNVSQTKVIQKKIEEDKKSPEKSEPKKEEVKAQSSEKKEIIPTKDLKQEPKKEEKKEDKKIPEKQVKKPEKKIEQKKPKQKEKTKNSDDALANSVLKSLQEGGKKSSKSKQKQQSLNDIMENAIKGDTTSEFNNESELSMSEIDAIRSQISKAWRVTSFSGGKDNKNLQLTVKIQVEENGEIKEIKVQSKNILNGVDRKVYNAFVDSVMRAIRMSSPLQHLPKNKHSTWNEMELVFDSSGMIY